MGSTNIPLRFGRGGVRVILSLILIAHFLGDFVLQTDAMAKGKSTSNMWLVKHVYAYSAVLFCGAWIIMPLSNAWLFAVANGLLHMATDYVTSRLSSKMWQQERVHDFFVVIGADQLIHTLTLYWTLCYFTAI